MTNTTENSLTLYDPTELEHARHARHEGLITPELRASTVFLIGAGMLGSFTAVALTKTGARTHVWDFDKVEPPNLGNQIYTTDNLGTNKAEALMDYVESIDVHLEKFTLDRTPERNSEYQWARPEDPHDAPLILISAVDSFAMRKALAEYAHAHRFDLFVDTRALGEIAVTGCVPRPLIERYIHELPDDAAAPDAPCGFEGAAYTGMLVGARTVAQINAFFRGFPVPYLRTEDMATGMELSAERLKGGDCWVPMHAQETPDVQPELALEPVS